MAEFSNKAELETALNSVEKDDKGIIVLSPYGFTIREVDGKQYVVALTREEAEHALANSMPLLPNIGICFTASNGACIQNTCTRTCVLTFVLNNWICICT
jgi:hypothetical protein